MGIKGLMLTDEFEYVSIRDSAIDFENIEPEEFKRYVEKHDVKLLKFKEDELPTIFVFNPLPGDKFTLAQSMFEEIVDELDKFGGVKRDETGVVTDIKDVSDLPAINGALFKAHHEKIATFNRFMIFNSLVRIKNFYIGQDPKTYEIDDNKMKDWAMRHIPAVVQCELAREMYYSNILTPEDKKKLE